MKTIRTIFTVLLATFAVNALVASEGNLVVNFESTDTDFAIVEMSSNKVSEFNVDITDAYGVKLYSSKTVTPTSVMKKKYDFSDLDDGTYLFKVKVDKETTTKVLEIENGEVELVESRKSIDPLFHKDDKMLNLTYLNFQEEDVKLYVYDSNRTLLAESKLGNDIAIHKSVDISKLRYGLYEVVITNDRDVYGYNLTID